MKSEESGRDWSQEGQLQKQLKVGSSVFCSIFHSCQPWLWQSQPLKFSWIISLSSVTVTCPHLWSRPVSLILFSLLPDLLTYSFSIFSPPFPFPGEPLSQMLWKTHTLWFPLLKVSQQFVWCTLLCLHLYEMQILWGGNYLPLHVNVMPSTVRSCFCLAQQIQLLLGTTQKHQRRVKEQVWKQCQVLCGFSRFFYILWASFSFWFSWNHFFSSALYIWDCRIINKAYLGEETEIVLFKLAGDTKQDCKIGELDKNSKQSRQIEGYRMTFKWDSYKNHTLR